MKMSFKYALVGLLTVSNLWATEIDCNTWIKKLAASGQNIPSLQALIPEIANLQIKCDDPKAIEKQIYDSLWQLESQKKLDPALYLLVKNIKSGNKIPALANVSDAEAVGMLGMVIRSELYDRGYMNPSFKFKGWEQLSLEQERLLKSLPKISSFKDQTFKNVFKRLTKMPMTLVDHTEVLDNNQKAFAKRIEMVRVAQKSIKLLTWGYYDDQAGKKFSDELIKKAKNKTIKIQVLVDFQVANRTGYKSELARLKANGIEVVGWKSTINPFYGMHSKMLIVDDQYCLEGGRNIGDVYLQEGKWSDLDVYHEGAIAQIINPNIFARIWNEQVSLQSLNYKKLPLQSELNLASGDTGTFLSAPQVSATDAVSNLTIYAIMNAKHEINITNAYFILTPQLKKSLVLAIKRGVKVRIYSNSMKSVDEPIVSIPIQKSLKEMYEAGAEIYMKEGQTLHTKVLIADDFSWYGSYNLHPRSGRYELEKVTISTNETFNAQLNDAIDRQLKFGKKVQSASELAYPDRAGMSLFFDLIMNQL